MVERKIRDDREQRDGALTYRNAPALACHAAANKRIAPRPGERKAHTSLAGRTRPVFALQRTGSSRDATDPRSVAAHYLSTGRYCLVLRAPGADPARCLVGGGGGKIVDIPSYRGTLQIRVFNGKLKQSVKLTM